MPKLNTLVIGGTGFIGKTLTPALLAAGHNVTVLARRPAPYPDMPSGIEFIRADVTRPGPWQAALPGFEAIVNLAGVSIFRRWTASNKQAILESRTTATRNIVTALLPGRGSVRQLFNVSGVGYYGYRGDEPLDETGPGGTDFLAGVAARWEEAAAPVKELGINLVIGRFGHVLGRRGGALPRLTTLARWHLAGRWGSGQQWLSWIHEDDLAAAVIFLLEHPEITGPVNIAAPNPVKNTEMMRRLAETTGHRAWIAAVPEWALRLMTGEFASVFVKGQRAIPHKLSSHGFIFKHPELPEALADLLGIPDEFPIRY